MGLARLFLIHAGIMFAAGVVLIAAPGYIPGLIGLELDPVAYLICYLLGASELGLAYLSYTARRIVDRQSLRIISLTFVVFHGASALLEGFFYFQGPNRAILLNIPARIAAVALFIYYGIYKNSD